MTCNSNQENRILRITLSVCKILLLLVIMLGFPAYAYFYHAEWFEYLKDPARIEALLVAYQAESIIIYAGLQIVQTIIAVIPAQTVQIAAGYCFPFWLAAIITIFGEVIGTVAVCCISKLLGRSALYGIFGKEKLGKYVEILNKKRAFIIVFVIYLIPGLPKDMFNYAISISDMKMKPFLITSLVARTPSMTANVLMGYALKTRSYTLIIVLAAVVGIICVLGIIKHKRLISCLDDFYVRRLGITE